jgi:ABC-type phosphate transport system permease subunit
MSWTSPAVCYLHNPINEPCMVAADDFCVAAASGLHLPFFALILTTFWEIPGDGIYQRERTDAAFSSVASLAQPHLVLHLEYYEFHLIDFFFTSLLLLPTANAIAVPRCSLPKTLAPRQPIGYNTTWSKQDILTLVGVCVAIVTVIIGLLGVLAASPRLRKWLYRFFSWITHHVRPSKAHHIPPDSG